MQLERRAGGCDPSVDMEQLLRQAASTKALDVAALSETVRDLLALRVLEQGDVAEVELWPALEDAIDSVCAGAVEKGMDARVDVDPSAHNIGTALSSAGLLHYAFSELAKNAIAHGMSPPKAWLRCVHSHGAVLIELRNRGTLAARAGDWFVSGTRRNDSESTYTYSGQHGSAFSGFGVGLPLCKLVMEVLGGSVHVRHDDDEWVSATMVLWRTGERQCV